MSEGGNVYWQQPLQITVSECLKKKMSRELSLGSDISTPGLLPRETIIQKDTSTTMFTEALLTIAKTQNQQNIHQQVND